MKYVRCCRLAALAIAPLALAMMLFVPDRPAEAKDAVFQDGGQIATVAKTTVKRASRRSRSRPAARRSAPRTQAARAPVPIPRPKPGTEAAAAPPGDAPAAAPAIAETPAPNTQTAARPAIRTPAIPRDPAAARAELRALYSVNALSYRCNFELTTREGAVLDREVAALEAALKLDTQQADALFSDVDLGLYGKGGDKICQKGGAEAKSFRATLDRLLGE